MGDEVTKKDLQSLQGNINKQIDALWKYNQTHANENGKSVTGVMDLMKTLEINTFKQLSALSDRIAALEKKK